eukprot:scaffold2614_cov57-Cylindrotheca_fusiformis.AAC.1
MVESTVARLLMEIVNASSCDCGSTFGRHLTVEKTATHRVAHNLLDLHLILAFPSSASDLQFLLTEDPDYEEDKFQSVIATNGVKQTEGWVKRMTPFFRESLQKAKRLPTAVRRTSSIRTVFRPLRSRIFNIRADPPPPLRATRATPEPLLRRSSPERVSLPLQHKHATPTMISEGE